MANRVGCVFFFYYYVVFEFIHAQRTINTYFKFYLSFFAIRLPFYTKFYVVNKCRAVIWRIFTYILLTERLLACRQVHDYIS